MLNRIKNVIPSIGCQKGHKGHDNLSFFWGIVTPEVEESVDVGEGSV